MPVSPEAILSYCRKHFLFGFDPCLSIALPHLITYLKTMKKLFIVVLIAATTVCCNTPQPATGSDPATSGSTGTGTDAGTGTTGTTTDSSTTGTAVTDTVRQR
jgi:hypothetical protein